MSLAFDCHWRTAAKVWAWTRNDGKGRPKNGEKPAFSMTEFAALGLRGLSDRATVAKYRGAGVGVDV